MPAEEKTSSYHIKSELSTNRRNFLGGLWHGAFLALGVSLTQPTTVISAFIADLTGSTIWVGGLSTVLIIAGALPQIFVARWIEPRPRKMPYLMTAIYLRVISWGILAWLIYAIGDQQPLTLAWILVGMLAIFYAGDFGGMGALAGPLSVGAAFFARYIMAHVTYPNNYALLFGLAAVGLLGYEGTFELCSGTKLTILASILATAFNRWPPFENFDNRPTPDRIQLDGPPILRGLCPGSIGCPFRSRRMVFTSPSIGRTAFQSGLGSLGRSGWQPLDAVLLRYYFDIDSSVSHYPGFVWLVCFNAGIFPGRCEFSRPPSWFSERTLRGSASHRTSHLCRTQRSVAPSDSFSFIRSRVIFTVLVIYRALFIYCALRRRWYCCYLPVGIRMKVLFSPAVRHGSDYFKISRTCSYCVFAT